MSRLVFVTGGARSGKSDFAMKLVEESGSQRVYIATATAGDAEMAERIRRHQETRGHGWRTVEEPLDIAGAVAAAGSGGSVLIDCLTLWLTNMMTASDWDGFEDMAAAKAVELADALKSMTGTSVVVSNEVGLGIVPADALTRKFRDAAGRANRIMAGAADEVYLVVSGIPVKIK